MSRYFNCTLWIGALLALCLLASPALADDPQWVVYEGDEGPGAGMHIVLVSGDDEYRSEESLPQLGRILAEHHGFKTTVLFPIEPESGTITPDHQTNIPGLEALETADLMIILTRFRNLPDEQMQYIDAYVNAGKPIIGMRTATHAFAPSEDSPYFHYHWQYDSDDWEGGFGRQVLGETWIDHHGRNSHEATRGRIAPGEGDHPILRGVRDGELFCTTNVYRIRAPLPGDSHTLVYGEVVDGMDETDPAVDDERNDPMMPVAWTRTYTAPEGTTGRAFTSTMGSSQGMLNEDHRRLIVNAALYLLDMDVPEQANVDLVGDYDPIPFGFETYREGVRPADHVLD